MRFLRWLRSFSFLGLLLLVLVYAFVDGGEEPTDFPAMRRTAPEALRAPPPREPVLRPLPPDASGPRMMIESDRPTGNTVGTAFAVDARGLWLTARHVTEGCREVLLGDRAQRWTPAQVLFADRTSDLALVRSRGAPGALPLGPAQPGGGTEDGLFIGQSGYAVGYPKQVPSAVRGTLAGRSVVGARGGFVGETPTTVWIERERVPSGDGPLGGISGGPLFDAEGRIIGVMIAATTRRGRFFAAAPETIRASLGALPSRDRPRPPRDPAVTFDRDPARFAPAADWLLDSRLVTRVACLRKAPTRRGTRG